MNDFRFPSNGKVYMKKNFDITKLFIANTFCQSLGTLLYRGSTVSDLAALKYRGR